MSMTLATHPLDRARCHAYAFVLRWRPLRRLYFARLLRCWPPPDNVVDYVATVPDARLAPPMSPAEIAKAHAAVAAFEARRAAFWAP